MLTVSGWNLCTDCLCCCQPIGWSAGSCQLLNVALYFLAFWWIGINNKRCMIECYDAAKRTRKLARSLFGGRANPRVAVAVYVVLIMPWSVCGSAAKRTSPRQRSHRHLKIGYQSHIKQKKTAAFCLSTRLSKHFKR